MFNEQGRKLWHTTPQLIDRRRYFEPITATTALALLTAAGGTAGVGYGIGSMFGGKKKDRNVPDPLAGLRKRLEGLADDVTGQVAKQKEINAARALEARTTGTQNIGENIRGECGFSNTSLQDRLNAELYDKLFKSQSEADLAADIWGTGQQASILGGTAGMYPKEMELPEEENWGANLLGAGSQMAMQNYMQENQWKNLAKYFGGSGGTPTGGGINPAGWANMMADPYANVGASIYSKL